MNTLRQPQKTSLLDRILIGALLLLGSLLIGIQIAKASPIEPEPTVTGPSVGAVMGGPVGEPIGDLAALIA